MWVRVVVVVETVFSSHTRLAVSVAVGFSLRWSGFVVVFRPASRHDTLLHRGLKHAFRCVLTPSWNCLQRLVEMGVHENPRGNNEGEICGRFEKYGMPYINEPLKRETIPH